MNYKDTVFLPRTDFPMRAGLPKKEPEILQSWQEIDLYQKLRQSRQDAPKFVLHDGVSLEERKEWEAKRSKGTNLHFPGVYRSVSELVALLQTCVWRRL